MLPHTSLCFVFSISASGRGNMMAAPARYDEVGSYHFTGGAYQFLALDVVNGSQPSVLLDLLNQVVQRRLQPEIVCPLLPTLPLPLR